MHNTPSLTLILHLEILMKGVPYSTSAPTGPYAVPPSVHSQSLTGSNHWNEWHSGSLLYSYH